MALLSKCSMCDLLVAHRASEIPLCDEHSGKNAAKAAEAKRWAALTTEQKLDELKAKLDSLDKRARYWDYNVPIG
jgi:hypothetical protein